MGFFDKPTEEEKALNLLEAQRSAEEKARKKATAKGFDVSGAIYVLEAFVPKDNEATIVSRPFVSIFNDKVVQNRKSVFNPSIEEVPLSRISSVEITTGLIPSVNIYTNGNTLTFRTDVLQGPKFVEVLRKELAKQEKKSSSTGSSDIDQLEKLSSLFEKGHLTKAEFDLKKKQILDS
jgi:hypothetical protein